MRRRPPILAILLLFAIPVRAELPQPHFELLETDLSLPRHAEAYYHPLGRHPVTDAVLADPLYLPVYGLEYATVGHRRSPHERLSAPQCQCPDQALPATRPRPEGPPSCANRDWPS